MFGDEEDLGMFEDHDQVKAARSITVRQDDKGNGLVVRRLCERCNLEVTVMIPWDELYCVSKGVLPHKVAQFANSKWVYDQRNGKMYPFVKCTCGQVVACPTTPSDAMRQLQSAKDGNTMSPAQLQSCQNLARAFAALQQKQQPPRR